MYTVTGTPAVQSMVKQCGLGAFSGRKRLKERRAVLEFLPSLITRGTKT